ncbi:MAG: hypothetical protein H0T46_09285 [Deltaproteobacteria bacterium]|nr:hypothetical protein [Deltaproteobacteria bacterium]
MNIGYAWAQLQKAIASDHEEKIVEWRAVIDGMRAGTIAVGSRTPTKAPAWVTLRVATGGFATGDYLAGAPLATWETQLAAERGLNVSRLALNLHFLEARETFERFESGAYRIEVPEEAALLVVAWLREREQIDEATALVEVLSPWFETLRFYPRFTDAAPSEPRATVRLQELSKTRASIANARRQRRFDTQRDAIRVWRPLFDGALAAAREAFAGTLAETTVAALRADLDRAGVPTTSRARDAVRIVEQLERFTNLDALERHALQHQVTTRGASRRDDSAAVAAPSHADLRRVLVARLFAVPDDDSAPADVMRPVQSEEGARYGVPAGSALPAYLEKKVARSWDASLEELVARRVIPSGETLAIVLPQVTGHLRAQTIEDPAARRLYAALYRAFRRRRGLLLLWLQQQVRLHELPWAAALEATRRRDGASMAHARDVVGATSALAIRAFPQTITPNKLVTELSALFAEAGVQVPLVEELAADIFMGTFTAKFVLAAKATARVLEGTLYQRYYAIDTNELAKLRVPSTDPKASPSDRSSPDLTALCKRRAPGGPTKSQVGANGQIIEQAQILTTHNLSSLFDALPLREHLGADLRTAADRCFRFVVRRVGLKHFRLAAYAWRQMIFYLSFVDDQAAFLSAARLRIGRAKPEVQTMFEPIMRGLELAAEGVASNQPAFSMSGARLLLAWSL